MPKTVSFGRSGMSCASKRRRRVPMPSAPAGLSRTQVHHPEPSARIPEAVSPVEFRDVAAWPEPVGLIRAAAVVVAAILRRIGDEFSWFFRSASAQTLLPARRIAVAMARIRAKLVIGWLLESSLDSHRRLV
jgi:hypothetical protein